VRTTERVLQTLTSTHLKSFEDILRRYHNKVEKAMKFREKVCQNGPLINHLAAYAYSMKSGEAG